MEPKRVLVTGSRDWRNGDAVVAALDAANPTVVVHGGCPTGADAFAEQWCWERGVVQEVYPADWNLGRKAGPLRNKQMVDDGADLVLAFVRDGSRGASGTVELARKAGIPVQLTHDDNDRRTT